MYTLLHLLTFVLVVVNEAQFLCCRPRLLTPPLTCYLLFSLSTALTSIMMEGADNLEEAYKYKECTLCFTY